jgi:SET domain-containing protein
MRISQTKKIFVTKSKIKSAGLGVFAHEKIKRREKIEVCPVLVMKGKYVGLLRQTKMRQYYFMWEKDKPSDRLAKKIAVAFGWGAVYNHSHNPNIKTMKDFKKETITFVATQDIKKGEELLHSYTNKKDQLKIWI